MSTRIAGAVVRTLKDEPFVLALLVLNVLVTAGAIYLLSEISAGIERKDALIATCLDERRRP